MSETKVENVKDFLDKLIEIQKSKSDNTELFFRGHADRAYEAEPTIFRKNGNGERNLLKNEKHLFNDMITQCPEDFKDCQYTFEYLVKMQHYGLPTRLLDITSNALVALYFACCSLNDFMRDGKGNIVCDKAGKEIDQRKDGQVLVFEVQLDKIENYNSNIVFILSSLVQKDETFRLFTQFEEDIYDKLVSLSSELYEVLNGVVGKEYSQKVAEILLILQDPNLSDIKESYEKDKRYQELTQIKLIEEIIKIVNYNLKEPTKPLPRLIVDKLDELFVFKSKTKSFINFIKHEKGYLIDENSLYNNVQSIICVKAKLNNQRIIRQNGLFFLFGMGRIKNHPITLSEYEYDPFGKMIPSINEITNPTIIIAAEKKADILKELRTLGISKETLMPEIDTVASTLKDRYN